MTYFTEKQLTTVLKELCKRVGANYNKIRFSDPEWYYGFTWSEKEQEKFCEWLIQYIIKQKIVTNEKIAERKARMFIFNYGWQVK
jgi:hypothetical protein